MSSPFNDHVTDSGDAGDMAAMNARTASAGGDTAGVAASVSLLYDSLGGASGTLRNQLTSSASRTLKDRDDDVRAADNKSVSELGERLEQKPIAYPIISEEKHSEHKQYVYYKNVHLLLDGVDLF